jgi:SLT domain-containing protein
MALYESLGTKLMADGGVLGGIGDWISGAASNVWGGITSAASSIAGAIGNITSWIGSAATGMVDQIKNAVRSMLPAGMFGDMGVGIADRALAGIVKLIQDTFAAQQAALAGPGGPPTVGGNLLAWIQAAEALTGVGPSWTAGLETLIMRESGGNPNAINLTDSNARAGHPSQGLMQTIPSTFAAYHQPGTSNSITDPVANIAAGINYIKARYGSISNVQQANPNLPPKGYAEGGIFNSPTLGMIGEAGPEVLLPLSRPDRLAELLRASGLNKALGDSGRGLSPIDLQNVAMSNAGIEKRLDDLNSMLKKRGAGATINVQDHSGDPKQTARTTMLALRLS